MSCPVDESKYAPFYSHAGQWKRAGNIRVSHPDDAIIRKLNKCFQWPPLPGTCDETAVPRWDRTMKHVPGVYDPAKGGWAPITEYPDFKAFWTVVCASNGEAGFVDTSYQTSMPGSGICHDDDWCQNTTIYRKGYFKFELCPCKCLDPGVDRIIWGTGKLLPLDTQSCDFKCESSPCGDACAEDSEVPANTFVNPVAGEVVASPAGFQIWKHGCDMGCGPTCTVEAFVDFTKADPDCLTTLP